jgi:AbrB family looped-hinge helix DNA binding protein
MSIPAAQASNSPNHILTISEQGWVVIPTEIRQKYGLQPGSRVIMIDYGGVLGIIPLLPEALDRMRGMLAGPTSLVESLLKERHDSNW